ncbi:hypothetical protein ACFQ9Z_39150 [Streptomyces sp. NPDC056580]|uniref:hypothetical protein n=1 Tax=Streptomyces sp. NPDC056580 TaxID=3345872 RepID=UPI0036C2FAFE
MRVTPSGYVLTRPDILDHLREEAARTRTHREFTERTITAFESEGPDAEPFLNDCPERIARLIFDEVAEAYDPADRAERDAARTTTLIRVYTLPYTNDRREAALRALRARQRRNARGLDRLRVRLTIG